MKYLMLILAAAFLVIAVLLILEVRKMKEMQKKQSAKSKHRKSRSSSKTKNVPADETADAAVNVSSIQGIHEEIFDDNIDQTHEMYSTSMPEEIAGLVNEEKKIAEAARKRNEEIYPNAVSYTGQINLDEIDAAEDEAVNEVVDRMMDDIFRSMDKETESAENDQNLDHELMDVIEEVNRNAETAAAETDETEHIGNVNEMIEKMVSAAESAVSEEVPSETEKEFSSELFDVINAVNENAENYAEQNAAESVPAAVEEKAADTLPVIKEKLMHSRYAFWDGMCGDGDPVLYFFRNEENCGIFEDAVRRMYERELYPAYKFAYAVCENREDEEAALEEIMSRNLDHNEMISKVMIDTSEPYAAVIGTAISCLYRISFGEMNELAKTELTQCAEDARAAGVLCLFENGMMTISAEADSEAESILEEVKEIAEHYSFKMNIDEQRGTFCSLQKNGVFERAVCSAVMRTFRKSGVRSAVLSSSEWNGCPEGFEAVWYLPAPKRAVSFYLNILVLPMN